MFKAIGGVLGFLIGFGGSAFLVTAIPSHYGIDVFHTYIIKPTPPPGGYHSVLAIPPSDWPFIVMLAGGIALAYAGSALGKKADRRLSKSAKA